MKLRCLLSLALASGLATSAAFSLSAAPSARLAPPPPLCLSRPGRTPDASAAARNRGAGRLSMSSPDEGDAAPGRADAKKLEGRKKRVIVGYKAMLASYLAVGAASIVRAGASFQVARILAAFLALPAGLSYILIGAAENDRLGSDTYKRLNYALFLNGVLGLGEIALLGSSMLALPFVLTAINSAKGYAYGVLGWDKLHSDTTLLRDWGGMVGGIVKGMLFTLPKNFKAAIYWLATASVSSLKVLKLIEMIQYVRANSFASGLAPLLARFNRYVLFSIVLYTLKDASDRDRLGGTTFIQLNYLSALSMGVNYAFYSGGMPEVAGAVSAAFALFFAFTGVSSYMKNQYA